MDNNVVDCLRNLASGFAYLADAIEQQQASNNQRMVGIEMEVSRNQQALKDAANAILSKFS